MKSRTIKVDILARVEGEGGLHIRIKGDAVAEVKLKIFEPPRFFEAFLRGRQFHEAPDITARICGICPVAYQMSAVHAMEDALGVKVSRPPAGPAPPALLRRVDRIPRPARLHAPRPGFSGLPGRHPDGPGPPRRGQDGPPPQEDRQPGGHPGGRPGDPSHQRPGGRLLPGAHQSGTGAPGGGTQMGPGRGPEDGALGGGSPHAGV